MQHLPDEFYEQNSVIGYQYFYRPSKQSSFGFGLSRGEDFNESPYFDKVFFRHDIEASTIVFDMSYRQKRFIPQDSLSKLARKIADTLRTAVSEQIISVMNIDAVNTVEDASLPTKPSSPNVKRNTLIGFLIGFVLSAGLIVLRSIMDDTVKNSDDVEKYLGVPVMGLIPDSQSTDITKEKL